jgi:pyruvate formate lyase activating enzyme
MKIGGLQKLTLIDFPGRLAATVFLLGCNFRCPFCYSSELVLPEKIENQPVIPEKQFFDFLKDRKGLLEGVVICGGEPTINKELPSFIKKIKKLGYFVKLDTNGSNTKMLKELVDKKLIDYVAMDIKAPKKKYKKTVGLSKGWNEKIMKNVSKSVDFLKELKIDFEFRTTLVPTLLEKKDILEIVNWIKPAPKYFLQNFKSQKTIYEYILEIQKAISPFFDVCQVR